MSTPDTKILKKTIFTPCRRIGLSRKVQTPSTPTQKSSGTPPPLPDSHGRQNAITENALTPQKSAVEIKDTVKRKLHEEKDARQHRKVLEDLPIRKKVTDDEVSDIKAKTKKVVETKETPKLKLHRNNDAKHHRKEIFKDIPINEDVTTNSQTETLKGKLHRTSDAKHNQEEVFESVSPLDGVADNQTSDMTLELKNASDIQKKSKSKTKPDSKMLKNIGTKKEEKLNLTRQEIVPVIVENVCQNISITQSLVKTDKSKPKRTLKRLSTKKSISNNSCDDLSDDEYIFIKTSSQSKIVSDGEISDNKLNSRSKRRRAVLSSSEEDELLEDNLEMKIDKLNEHIKQKMLHLQNLRQASLYNKMHKVEELEELTRTWKTGCKDALRELHKSLQSHNSISMTSLLQKLNIPKDFLSYDANSDVFT